MSGVYFNPLKRIFLNLSGGTVTGDTVFTQGVSANTLSGDILYSGNTNLYDIFLTTNDESHIITRVQPGLNIYTGGTDNFPTINISAATLSYLSATTISGGTIYVENDFTPITDNNSDIGTTIKRFRNLNIINGVSVNFTATTRIDTPEIILGNTLVNENNIILSGYTLEGGSW